MAIVFNTPSSVAIQGAATATVSHTVPSGSDRVLWVIASCFNSVDYLAAATATYGGVSLGSPIFADTAAATKTTYIWQLASPTVGTANVVVTPSASAHLDVWVINANGVDLGNLPTSASVSLAPLNPSSPTSYAVTTPSGGANLGYFLHREAATSGITPITGFSLVGTAPASSYGQTRLATAQAATNHGWTWTGTGGVTTIAQMSVQIRAAVALSAPVFTTQPAGTTTVTAGATATFGPVATSGSPTPTYQWQYKPSGGAFANISGATGTSYTTPALTTANNGDSVQCIATNSLGTATSTTAALVVNSSAVGTLTSGVLKRNNGTLVASATLTWLTLLNGASGAFVATKTSVAVNSSGIFTTSDAGMAAGTVYQATWLESTGERGCGWAAAT